VSKAACDAIADFDFEDWTPVDILHDLRRTKHGTLEASLRLYALGKKLHDPEYNDFWRENFISNKFFITKSLAFYYIMVGFFQFRA
jgi:hypothetical protein